MRRHLIGLALFFSLTGATILFSPAMAETKAEAGAAAENMPVFAITYRAGPRWKPGVPMKEQGLREHFFYVKALHEQGRVFAGGAMGDDAGLLIFYAPDQAAADAILAGDPAIQTGVFVGEVRRFTPRFTVDGPLKLPKP